MFVVDDLIDQLVLCVQRRSAVSCFPKESKLAQSLKNVRQILRTMPPGFNQISFGSLTDHVSRRHRRPATISHPLRACSRSQIIAVREHAMKSITSRILDMDGAAVVAIAGRSGIGKTSLARLIYNDPVICSKYDIRLWVDAEYLKLEEVIDQIRVKAMEQNSYLHHYYFDIDIAKSLKETKLELRELLLKNRFLLVVDALECAALFDWIGEVIDMDTKGSAVMVTMPDSSLLFSPPRPFTVYSLSPLSEEESYNLLIRYSFAASSVILDKPELKPIAKEIVNRCEGNPLALKMVGTYLYDKDHLQQWKHVLDVLEVVSFKYDNRVPIILPFISYKLPSYLKLPFCSLSLQKVSQSVEELICLWMALGFLYSDDPNQQPEYIGRKYLTELAESALCPDVEFAPGGVVRDIKMHHLVCKLAREEASQQGFLVYYGTSRYINESARYLVRDVSRYNINESARYLVWDADYLPDLLANILNAPRLRLFILCTKGQASAHFVRGVVSHLIFLRVLGLGGCDIQMLPDSIGQLKHLRYLDVGRNVRMKSLPDSICNLWYLQTLLLHGCDQLEALPAGIGRLQNLRYLTLTTLQESLPEEIGQLTSLRTLGLASCPRLSSLPGSIKNLKNLQTLGIADCPDMDLAATSSAEGLRGLEEINTLLIAGIPNFECLPTDMGNPSVVLKHLLVQSCKKMTDTAWINQFRSLHSLTIEGCPELSTLATDGASQFNSLVELVIRDCPSIENTTWISQFGALRSLIIDGCRNLVVLDAGFIKLKSLERLEIRKCPHLSKKCASPDGEDWPLIAHVQVIELDGQSLKP